jgi:2,4-dienoyl-CoA reductase-like NADH-dependent reductase (Old Yellow Enzyme family)
LIDFHRVMAAGGVGMTTVAYCAVSRGGRTDDSALWMRPEAVAGLRRLTEAPRLADLTGFGQFLQNLRNQGMQPILMGDFPASGVLPLGANRRGRPYLVK